MRAFYIWQDLPAHRTYAPIIHYRPYIHCIQYWIERFRLHIVIYVNMQSVQMKPPLFLKRFWTIKLYVNVHLSYLFIADYNKGKLSATRLSSFPSALPDCFCSSSRVLLLIPTPNTHPQRRTLQNEEKQVKEGWVKRIKLFLICGWIEQNFLYNVALLYYSMVAMLSVQFVTFLVGNQSDPVLTTLA